jgi:hypothetical protein
MKSGKPPLICGLWVAGQEVNMADLQPEDPRDGAAGELAANRDGPYQADYMPVPERKNFGLHFGNSVARRNRAISRAESHNARTFRENNVREDRFLAEKTRAAEQLRQAGGQEYREAILEADEMGDAPGAQTLRREFGVFDPALAQAHSKSEDEASDWKNQEDERALKDANRRMAGIDGTPGRTPEQLTTEGLGVLVDLENRRLITRAQAESGAEMLQKDPERFFELWNQNRRDEYFRENPSNPDDHNPEPNQYEDDQGNRIWLDDGSPKDMQHLRDHPELKKVRSESVVGKPEDFRGGNPALRDWDDTQALTMNALATMDIAMNGLIDNPDAYTNVGALAGLVSGFGAEIEAFGRLVGIDVDPRVMDITQYSSFMTELGVDNAEMQSAMFQIALAWAGASGLGQGRALTDKDVEHALTAIGARGMKTPEARMAVLGTARDALVRNFKHRYFVVHGNKSEYEGDLMGLMTGKPSPSAEAVQYLRDNPGSAALFNTTFGDKRADNFLGR